MTTCLVLLVVAFCDPPPVKAPADSYCQIAKPLLWHPSDTRRTKEQADAHNRVWKRLCGGGRQ